MERDLLRDFYDTQVAWEGGPTFEELDDNTKNAMQSSLGFAGYCLYCAYQNIARPVIAQLAAALNKLKQ